MTSNLHEKAGAFSQSNFDVDYVIDYRFTAKNKDEAEAQFLTLIQDLDGVGLKTEVRQGEDNSVLVLAKLVSIERLKREVYHSRVQDWLFGVRSLSLEKDMDKAIANEPVTPAEKLRLIYLLITKPTSEGGAGITPKEGKWTCVNSIFPLHDNEFNKNWIKKLSSKYYLDPSDLSEIKDMFGESIAFYFSFLQCYFLFLTFPAVIGLSAWFLLDEYSGVYGAVNALWSIVFIEFWKKQQVDLAVQWGVRGVSQIQLERPGFVYDKEVQDPITGETIKVYSHFKRFTWQLLQIPFAVAAASILGALIAFCFGIEIFISEIYDGPFKSYLTFLPTIILSTAMPTLSSLLTQFAAKLTDLENYATTDAHHAAMVRKIFILNFIASYLPIFLTAFVYVPYAQIIVPHLDVFQVIVKPFAEDHSQTVTSTSDFQINPDRLKKQVIYFTVTAQIVNFALEIVVPYVKRVAFRKVKDIQASRAAKRGESADGPVDLPEEAAFLDRVRSEAELDEYDVTTDFREMIVQFGYLTLFSVIWPMTAVSFLINNWIELRGDALKIAIETKRPVPWRADSIGPWLDSLGFLAWMGSLSTAALVYLFSGGDLGPDGSPSSIKGWALLLTIFFSEHIFLGVQLAVRNALRKLDSVGLQKERADRFAVKKQYVQESLVSYSTEKVAASAGEDGSLAGKDITRSSLEEEARRTSLKGQDTPVERFWLRQQGMEETIIIGRGYIAKATSKESKKEL